MKINSPQTPFKPKSRYLLRDSTTGDYFAYGPYGLRLTPNWREAYQFFNVDSAAYATWIVAKKITLVYVWPHQHEPKQVG